jgi:uncharacterized coiled-coil protein SlyX
MKKIFKDEKKVELYIRKDDSISEIKLNEINLDDLLNSLLDIYYDKENYYILYIDKELNKLQKKRMSAEETQEKINKHEKSEGKSKKAKKKRRKNINVVNVEKNFEDNKIQEQNQLKTESLIKKDKDKREKKFEIQRGNNFIIKENIKNKVIEGTQKDGVNQKNELQQKTESINISNDPKSASLQEQYIQLSSLVKNLEFQMNELKEKENKKEEKIIKLVEKINELEEEDNKNKKRINELEIKDTKNETQISEMKMVIMKHKKKHQKYKKMIKNIKRDLLDVKKDSLKINNELRLIKMRDVFKNIIDLFCNAFQIDQEAYYIDKILDIKKKIKNQKMKEDEKIQLITFFEKIYFDIQFSNKNAHSLDLSQSIIEQVFIYVDPDKELNNVKIKLMKGNVNEFLKKLAYNKINNFNNRIKCKLEEEKLIESATEINDLYPIA